MSEKKAFYITTTLPYVNADPHIGFASELVQADALARFRRLTGGEVFFGTGTDEHGQKILQAAEKAGEEVKKYADRYAATFEDLKKALDLSYDSFVRTTDEHHAKAAQEMWRLCKAKGDIYEKEFEGLYCVGCERFLSQRDIVDGKCVLHPWATPEYLKEKNWFFRLSKYQKELLDYLQNPQVIIPEYRREEAIKFVEEGLEDFSISRDKSRFSWGIPVPDDDTQVMYVWFDALTNYISTLGWPDEKEKFEKFWQHGQTLQLAGKDQVRFQSIMWQAMLLSAGIKNTDQIFYHGHITTEGQKMSKSLGNVINPYDLVKKYGTDATRYLLLRHVHPTEDSDITREKLDEWYEAHLVNGLGNLVSRIMQLAQTHLEHPAEIPEQEDMSEYFALLERCEINKACEMIWQKIGELDKEIQEKKPWETKDKDVISSMALKLYTIARMLNPIMPDTNAKLKAAIRANKKPENLFPRLNA